MVHNGEQTQPHVGPGRRLPGRVERVPRCPLPGRLWTALPSPGIHVGQCTQSSANQGSSPKPRCPKSSGSGMRTHDLPSGTDLQCPATLEVKLVLCDPRPPPQIPLSAHTIWGGPRPQVNKDIVPGRTLQRLRDEGRGRTALWGRQQHRK